MDDRDQERYSRQILFAPIGDEGQRRLLESRAALVGCGALGSFHADALARAGVGELLIIDRDFVEQSNLQRQWLFDEEDAARGLPKAAAAARKLQRINSGVRVRAEVADLTADNAEELLSSADVILDGTDNFETRYLINETAVKRSIPWIYGAAVGSQGVLMPVLPGESACLACVFPEPPGGAQPTCDTAGVLSPVTAAVAALQTAEALKILSGNREAVEPRLLTLDVWSGSPRTISTRRRDPDCRVCGRREFRALAEAGRSRPAVLCGRNAVQIHDRRGALDLVELARALGPLGSVRSNEHAVRLSVPPYELTIFADGRAIIKGVTEIAAARSLYARYVGV